MAKAKRLSSKQLALIEDLFAGKLDEQTALEEHKVSRQLYYRWLADGQFAEQLNQRVAGARRQSIFLVASYARTAAEKLTQLTDSKNPETARKACLDVITMNSSTSLAGTLAAPDDKTEKPAPISPQTASRMLALLAEKSNDQ